MNTHTPPKVTEPPRAQQTTRLKLIGGVCCAFLIAVLATLVLVVRAITYHPRLSEAVAVARKGQAQMLKAGQTVKVKKDFDTRVHNW